MLVPKSSFRFQIESVLDRLRIVEQEVRDASWERLVFESFDPRARFDRGAWVVDERDHVDVVDLDPESRRFRRRIDFAKRLSTARFGAGAPVDVVRSTRSLGGFIELRIKFRERVVQSSFVESRFGRSRERRLERVFRFLCGAVFAFARTVGLVHTADDLSRVFLRLGRIEFHVYSAGYFFDVEFRGAFVFIHTADDLSVDVFGFGFGFARRVGILRVSGGARFGGFTNRRPGFGSARFEHSDGLSVGVVSKFKRFDHRVYQHGIGALSRGERAHFGNGAAVV